MNEPLRVGTRTPLEVVKNRPHVPLDVVIPRIVEIGLLEKPNEACGVIVPELSKAPTEWVRQLKNLSEEPTRAYAIDPVTIKDLLAAPDVWADVLVWHTHPSGFVGPSRGDMKDRIEGIKYLVVSLPYGEAVMF